MAARSSACGPMPVVGAPVCPAPVSHCASEPTAGLSIDAGVGLKASSSSVITTARRAGNGVPTARIFSHCSAWLTMSIEASQSARM